MPDEDDIEAGPNWTRLYALGVDRAGMCIAFGLT